jgi:hypothetical protein
MRSKIKLADQLVFVVDGGNRLCWRQARSIASIESQGTWKGEHRYRMAMYTEARMFSQCHQPVCIQGT